MQNNYNDYRSNFIYQVETVEDCIREANNNWVSVDYALHRWYNYKTSKYCEKIFVENGAIKEEDLKLISKIDVSVNEQIKAKFSD